eukprot:8772583-Karenia_brevis.AAC.1
MQLSFTINPTAMYAAKAIEAEKLCLVPQVALESITVSKADGKGIPTGHCFQAQGQKYQLYISK